MTEDLECPHCGTDLTGEWVHVSVTWGVDDDIDAEAECPECGRDMGSSRERPPQDRVPEGERLARRIERKREDFKARARRLGLRRDRR